MKYKIETLKIGNDKSIDIPEGCIPINYDCSVERFIRTLTILKPIENIEDKEYIEEKCFFCEKNLTRDKIGIRPICPICISELYGLARKSHESQEC